MPCFSPLPAWRGGVQKSGKRSIIFSRKQYGAQGELVIPCGRCVGCMLKRARDWAVRIHCENTLVKASSFLTLTYSPKHLPRNGSLSKRHHQLFLKRLRKTLNHPVRYFLCGEYGERFQRPHYHVILFGEDFRSDRVLHSKPAQHPLYSSKILDQTWGLGKCLIGDVTLASAAYVARYAMKKVYGDKAHAHYKGRQSEYICMSRRPGIGSDWLARYVSDVFPSDEVIVNGVRNSVPPYFLDLYSRVCPSEAEAVKQARIKAASTPHPDKSPMRLFDRERVQKSRMTQLYRPFDMGQTKNTGDENE